MSLRDRLSRLASALPSEDASVVLSKRDILALVQGEVEGEDQRSDLTVEQVADETGRAPSTVRGWLLSGHLRGYKLNGRDWRVPPHALRAYLDGQSRGSNESTREPDGGDISDWRHL